MAKQKKRTYAEIKASAEKALAKLTAGKKVTKNQVKDMIFIYPEMMYDAMPDQIKELFPVVTMQIASEVFGLHFTMNHNAKMAGNYSFSTSCKFNVECLRKIQASFRQVIPDFVLKDATATDIKKARILLEKLIKENPLRTDISICGLCFADRQQDNFPTMQDPLRRNFEIWNNGIVHPDWLPVINALWFRLESFGDYGSVNSAKNADNIMKKNPAVYFGVWTKNPKYFDAVYQGNADNVPKNASFIYSSQFINRKARIPAKYKYFLKMTFTVYTQEYASANNVKINCGARACLACLKCYTKNNIMDIAELLK